MFDLTEKELFSAARLLNETQTQYKARRRTINLATRIYIKSNLSNDTARLIDYVRAIIETTQIEY